MNPMNPIVHLLLADGMWVLVIAGWIMLVVTGLEADKPLSGGIPGHADPREPHTPAQWSAGDRLGEAGGWTLFALVSLSLPVILYWVFTQH